MTHVNFFLLIIPTLVGLVVGSFPDIWNLSLLDNEKYPKAQCLDGSQGGFWLSPGFGSGKNKYIIHHQGGGWCIDMTDCYNRSKKYLGSSKTWETSPNCTAGSSAQPCKTDEGDHGMLSRNPQVNPLTYNWNRIYIGYCDGGSYAGQVEDAVPVHPEDSASPVVFFRGRYILDALYETFLSSPEVGMSSASEIIISGTSAGGLAVYIHADYLVGKINEEIQRSSKVLPRIVAVPDAGFFMDVPSVNGTYLYTPNYKNVFVMQNIANSVDADCMAYYQPLGESWKCFMAPYTLPFVQTPMFIVNSMVDSWQGEHIMGLTCSPTVAGSCDSESLAYLDYFRDQMIHNTSMTQFIAQKGAGAWLVECYTHCLLDNDHYYSEVQVESRSMMQTLSSWYNAEVNQWTVIDGTWNSNVC